MIKKIERNQIFNYLYVLAIIMVIDDHMNSRIGFLTGIFPYNSFYMPLFVFISGYFYKRKGIIENTVHKVKKLLLPYLLWNFIAIILAFFLDKIFGIDWIKIYSIKDSIIKMLTTGSLTSLNGAAWFIIMLFWVSVIYNVIHFKIKDSRVLDLILTIIYILIGFVSLQMCIKGYASRNVWWLFILKISFYIQFFHYGNIFRKYIEEKLQRCNKALICSICIFINVCLISVYGGDINFYSTSSMNFFKSWYLPLITSFSGIIFYYEIMQFLSNKIGQTKITDFISRNTFTILETHLLFCNIPNFYIFLRIKSGSQMYYDFNYQGFIKSAWVRYNTTTCLLGFVMGIIGSLLVAWLIEKIKETNIVKNIKDNFILKKNN